MSADMRRRAVHAQVSPARCQIRHAADLGAVTVQFGELPTVGPTAYPVWVKGAERRGSVTGPDVTFVIGVSVTRPESRKPIVSTATEFGGSDGVSRLEFILVGTKARNARIVLIRRLVGPGA